VLDKVDSIPTHIGGLIVSQTKKSLEQLALELQRAIHDINFAYNSADANVSRILTLHLFVERQLDVILARSLARPAEVARFSFGHKVGLFKALWNHPRIDTAAAALLALNDIRNASAHNDMKALGAGRIKLATHLSGVLEKGSINADYDLELTVIVLMSFIEIAIYDAESALSIDNLPIQDLDANAP